MRSTEIKMMVYTPTFLKIKEILTKPIVLFLKDQKRWKGRMIAKGREIHEHIKKLKEREPERYKVIDFIYMSPYSDQVADVITDLIRNFLIEQHDEGYELTSFGEEKKNWV